MLIHGAEPLNLIVYDDFSTQSTVQGDMNQGYGRANVMNSLCLYPSCHDQKEGEGKGGLGLFVRGASDRVSDMYVEIRTVNEVHEYTVTTRPGNNLQPLRVTLAYTVMIGLCHLDSSIYMIIIYMDI